MLVLAGCSGQPLPSRRALFVPYQAATPAPCGRRAVVHVSLALTTTRRRGEAMGTATLGLWCQGEHTGGTWLLSPAIGDACSGSQSTPLGLVLVQAPLPRGLSWLAALAEDLRRTYRPLVARPALTLMPEIDADDVPRERRRELDRAGLASLPVAFFAPGDRIRTRDGSLSLQAIATTGPSSAPNLVTRLSFAGVGVLFTGRADTAALDSLVDSGSSLRSA